MAVRPRLIVELGVRSGESTFALERVARLCGSTMVSVDVEPPVFSFQPLLERLDLSSKVTISTSPTNFPDWCRARNISPRNRRSA